MGNALYNEIVREHFVIHLDYWTKEKGAVRMKAMKKQVKLLANGFERAGVSMDEEHWIPVMMGMKNTDEVFGEIKAAVARLREAAG